MAHRSRLASQSAIIFAARVFGAGIVFLAQAAIARHWGAMVLGEYLLFVATVNLMAVFMPLGFHTVGTYFTAEYRARKDRRMLWHFVRRSYGHVIVVSLLVGIFGAPIAGLLGEPGRVVGAIWIPSALLAAATAIIYVNSAVLVGLRRPIAGYFFETLFRPLLVIAAFAIAVGFFDGTGALHAMLWMLSLGYIVVSLTQFIFVVKALKDVEEGEPDRPAETMRWWRFALPWAMISLATDFFFDIDLILLASHMDRQELAIFGICTRIFSLVSFGVAAVYAVTLPDVFESEANSDREGFLRKIGDANLVAAGLALVLLIGVFLGGRIALSIFGPDFVAGAWPLVLLCTALLVRSVFGPASLVLSIHDRPYASLPAVACGLISLGLLNYVLVPPYGLMGAAVAALISITIWSATLWATAWRVAGIDVSILSRLNIIGPKDRKSSSRSA